MRRRTGEPRAFQTRSSFEESICDNNITYCWGCQCDAQSWLTAPVDGTRFARSERSNLNTEDTVIVSTLEQRLAAIRKASAKNIPEDAQKIMYRVTEELQQAGLAEKAIGEGDQAPAFALPNQDGKIVRSDELLKQGPVVLSFFRGHW
jgi:hypothetical protein